MLTRVLSVGLLAGVLAGLLIALVQQVTTTPLILRAETYEKGSEAAPAAAGPTQLHEHAHDGAHDGAHDAAHEAAHGEGWKPADGAPRFFYTSVATVATAVGVAFLLLAGLLFAGDPVEPRVALGWAVAGFVATGLAPAAGLAPELPGSASGGLLARQLWWIGTAMATGLALWALLRIDNVLARAGGIALLVAPHVIGAPHPHAFESRVPAEIAAQFAALSLVVQGLLWVSTGVFVAVLWQVLARRTAGQPVTP